MKIVRVDVWRDSTFVEGKIYQVVDDVFNALRAYEENGIVTDPELAGLLYDAHGKACAPYRIPRNFDSLDGRGRGIVAGRCVQENCEEIEPDAVLSLRLPVSAKEADPGRLLAEARDALSL